MTIHLAEFISCLRVGLARDEKNGYKWKKKKNSEPKSID